MRLNLHTAVAILLMLIPVKGLAKKFEVNSQNSFIAAHNNASPIEAETPGKTVFTGASKVRFTGNNNPFSGFQYLKGNIGTDDVIHVTGSHNHLTQLNIRDYYCYKYVVISEESQYTTLSYCNLENRTFIGDKNILSILVSEQQPGYHTIRYCSFKNFEGSTLGGDAGVEPIRIGLSTQGDFISRSTGPKSSSEWIKSNPTYVKRLMNTPRIKAMITLLDSDEAKSPIETNDAPRKNSPM